jgi:hypothetical protein
VYLVFAVYSPSYIISPHPHLTHWYHPAPILDLSALLFSDFVKEKQNENKIIQDGDWDTVAGCVSSMNQVVY